MDDVDALRGKLRIAAVKLRCHGDSLILPAPLYDAAPLAADIFVYVNGRLRCGRVRASSRTGWVAALGGPVLHR